MKTDKQISACSTAIPTGIPPDFLSLSPLSARSRAELRIQLRHNFGFYLRVHAIILALINLYG